MGRCVATLAALVVLAAASASAESAPGDPVRGARLYSDNCGRCHNPRSPNDHRDREWSITMQHMRVLAGLPGQQARDVEAFLRASNNPPRWTGEEPATEARGSQELLERFGCRGCHRIHGEGGTVGPDLAGVFERRDEVWVDAQIRDPRSHNAATIMPTFGFSDAQVRAILELLRAP